LSFWFVEKATVSLVDTLKRVEYHFSVIFLGLWLMTKVCSITKITQIMDMNILFNLNCYASVQTQALSSLRMSLLVGLVFGKYSISFIFINFT
jgi:hypothetical protein